jgi:hypothetical protein
MVFSLRVPSWRESQIRNDIRTFLIGIHNTAKQAVALAYKYNLVRLSFFVDEN